MKAGRGSALARVTAALEAAGCGPPRGTRWRCPAHDDSTPSLDVVQGERGVLLYCFAGCPTSDVLRALRLTMADTFDEQREQASARRENGRTRPQRAGEYVYTDRHGEPLARKVRWEPGFDGRSKSFSWELPDGNRWRKAGRGEGNPRVLYNLALLAEAGRVHVCEGEKAADALNDRFSAGGVADDAATCAPTTAWEDSFTAVLRGKCVVLWVDRDSPGETQARAAFDALRAAGVNVQPVRSRIETERADAFDHLAAGFSPDEGEPFTFPEDRDAAASSPEPAPIGFSGARLLALLDRPPIAALEPGIPAPGHFNLLVAPAFIGKTSLVCWLAMARAGGVAPWLDVTRFEQGRALIVSLDEAVEQVARRMSALATFHPAGRLANLAEQVLVIGPDRELPAGALDRLRLAPEGLGTLEELIARAAEAGAPFREVYLDAYADFLPLGESENSNEEATRIGGALEAIAIRTGPAIVALHHSGKPKEQKDDALPDLRFIGRGASALAAKARVVMALESVSGQPHVRRIRTATNLTRAPGPAYFQVAPENAGEGELLYFRVFDPLAAYDPRDLVPGADEEPIPTSLLAWRLANREAESGKEPPTEMKVLAARLRDDWQKRGLVDVLPGKRGAKLIRLRVGRSA